MSLGAAWGQAPDVNMADTILVGGKIITVNATDSIAEAVAIKGGKIIDVGSRLSVMEHRGAATHVIDLRDRTVTPGLIDSHLHFASVDPVYSIHLSDVHNIGEVCKRVSERVAKAKPGEWIPCRTSGELRNLPMKLFRICLESMVSS